MLTLERTKIVQGTFTLTADWSVPALARVALIGPSGGGKSTLLLAIAGFLPLQTGRILWQGHDFAPLAPFERPLTMLFQDQNLFPHLTVAQNIGLGLDPKLNLTALQKVQIRDVLDQVGMADMGARKPAALSGGQLARVALARSLLRQRPLLLLDEPFSALGPALKAEMLDLVADVATAADATVLLVTHDVTDARQFASQTVLVENGVAHAPQATDTLFQNPPSALSDYLGQTVRPPVPDQS